MSSMARVWLLILILVAPAAAAEASSCSAYVAQWYDPAKGRKLDQKRLFKRLKKSSIVLLGEAHTSAAHHRWQHYMLAALHSRRPNLQVGFEMLPRAAQPVLDDWSAGRLDADEMLERARWQQVWGYDPELYLPLLYFVRQNRLPAIGLNVERGLVARVGDEGWDAIAESEREGVSDPAPASPAYRESLARLYAYKQSLAEGDAAHGEQEPDLQATLDSEDFGRFVEAQLTWDRAMAEALAAAHRRDPDAVIVGIVGRGHLEYGHGIPHQLADLGIDDVDVLLPVDAGEDCDALPKGLASAVFVVDGKPASAPPPRARLGVYIENADGGVRVTQVVDDSVAARSGIRDDDLIEAAAGFDTATTEQLIEIVQRQAPGTWLPLRLRRDGKSIEIVAKFPQSFD